ncbi:MAG: hypothetical protein FWG16_01380, partial [Micrococcales bacterium]|nr:hypothetical protein [Micrococcales bacterium]
MQQSASSKSAHWSTRLSRVLVISGALLLIVGFTPIVKTEPAGAAPASTAKTVTAAAYDPDYQNAPFPDLAVTVSQTTDLMAQGIQVRWGGGKQ